MSKKYALIIGTTEYTDAKLPPLNAPIKDAETFASLLKDPKVCSFDEVNILINQPSMIVIEAIDEFFDQKKPDDLLVLYFSGHGIKDEAGSLYLAFKNTIRTRLRATAIKADYIREAMDQSRSKRQVLILDCCNSGAFPPGTKAELGGSMGMTKAFQGYGRFILTASDATQFAWEGDQFIGETENSLFTHFLIKGLKGDADSDGDGRITVDELYDYAYDQISKVTPKQTPTKSAAKVEGEIVLRQDIPIQDIRPIELPDDLIAEIDDTRPLVREGAVQRLVKILNGRNIGLRRSAIEALNKIIDDENTTRRVAQLSTQALEAYKEAEEKAESKRLAILRAEEERIAREKAEAERKEREEAERLQAEQERKARQEAERLAFLKAEEERLTRDKAEAERIENERIAKQESARIAAQKTEEERLAREKAEEDRKANAAKRLQQIQAEREAAEKTAREKLEREASERTDAQRYERPSTDIAPPKKVENVVDHQKGKSPSAYAIPLGITGIVVTAACILFAAIKFLPGVLGSNPTSVPTVVESPVVTKPSLGPTPSSALEVANNLKSSDPAALTNAVSNASIDTLDPALAYDNVSTGIIRNIYETLVFYDGEALDKFVPLLAESWEVSADGKTWIFHIRKGIKFHNGDELTPADVAYSFQRGILQGGTISPQLLFAEPFLGAGIDDITLVVDPSGGLYDDRDALKKADRASLKSACEKVTSAIVADNGAGTVTMTLSQSWGPFLASIAQPWGSVMDKNWVISNKGWDGSCDTWQNFYGMQSADDPFSAIENGTGPFKLSSLKQNEEVVLSRNDNYWREPARLESVIIRQVSDSSQRLAMLQAGEADMADVPAENSSQLDELIGERCRFNFDSDAFNKCEIVDDTKPLRVHFGRPDTFQNVITFNFNIDPSGNSYIGSGKLDGNGIPPDFFADIHVRKAFAYCFDWDTFITKAYNGDAIQSFQIPLPGMPGYFPNFPHYSLDLNKCEAEFKASTWKAANGGSVWDTGFRIQLTYNQGNTARQKVMENFSANLGSVNSNFRIETLGVPWATYLTSLRARQLPIMLSSWVEDIHDPQNWYEPYTLGTHALRQNLPSNLMDQFRDILTRGRAEMDPAARANLYREANQLYYDQAIGLPLVLTNTHSFEQRWVFGRILNPIIGGKEYYYPIYKQ